jgi:hypothetical protein
MSFPAAAWLIHIPIGPSTLSPFFHVSSIVRSSSDNLLGL